MKYYVASAGALIGYLVLAWVTGAMMLHLEGTRLYWFWGILGMIGITGWVVWTIFVERVKRSQEPAADSAAGGGDEVDTLVREAEARLAASSSAKGAKLSNLPVVFVLGATGSTKTTTLLNSGLDAELLAGQVYQDANVVPTRSVNVWFARQMVFVEAGGRLLTEAGLWASLLRRLQPRKLQSVVGGAAQAQRAAVVCVDGELFSQAGAADALAGLGRALQGRLGEISQQFGVSFPVYVIFTKMNRIAFFEDYVRNLSNDEAGQVLGATMPIAPFTGGSVYAEEQSRRLSFAFDGIFQGLADHRLSQLPRESDPMKASAAYEFPREFRKLRGPLVQFLVELCRPSQLNVSPFLRGFYFSGVRPVTVRDVAPEAPRAASHGMEAPSSATGVFKVPGYGAPQAAVPSGGTTRRVPQWIFLQQLFNHVLVKDEAALGASGSSTKTSTMQRALLALAAVLCLFAMIGFTVSFFGNRALQSEAMEAAKGIPASEASGMNLPSQDALQRLERLRASLAQLTEYEEQGAPWRLRWLLYSGNDLLPRVRKLYYARFQQLLFGQTQAEMLAHLQRLKVPPEPTDEYSPTYDTLKAYLVTTSEWKRSGAWLSPLLVQRWGAGRNVEPILPLARKQFDFYSEDLARGNPFTEQNQAEAVDRARVHLSKFSGTEQIYQFMLADAGRRSKKVNFNEQFAGSAEAVINNRDVPGAFTKAGWAAMLDNIKKADKFFGGERWVLGDYAAAKPDMAKLGEELRTRYEADYIAKWREFMKNTRVLPYASLQDAAKKLNLLSGAQTPLMALFWVATQNTAVDSPRVLEAFDPVHKTVPPPATTVQYVLPPNQEYMGSLASLQTTVGQVADQQGPPDPARAQPIRMAADSARNVVKKMGYTFKIDPEAHMETTALRLLEAPIQSIDALTKNMGAGEVNGKAGAFCAAFSPVMNKFPFNPNAAAEATLQEVSSIFRPREGRLWIFYEESLRNFLQKQGNLYVANPASGLQMNPLFVNFFNNAARFSDTLYPGGATEPSLRYSLQFQRSELIKEMTLAVDGQSSKLTGAEPAKQFVWPGVGTRSVRLSGKVSGGPDFEFQNRDGLWAVFRFFADADRRDPAGTAYNLEWVFRQGREGGAVRVGGKEVTYRFTVDTGGGAPVFNKEFLNSLRCVPNAAK
ncbi:MAG: hypothetical protein IPP47_15260 [Bryobacterales bacterium]|nr:hypothetical protein [Bryobacterales bacterium]